MTKQYALILPSLYTGSLRKAGPYVLADWPWILSHMDRHGFVEVSERILADEIGGLIVEHQKALEWLEQADPKNECQRDRLIRVGRYAYVVANHERYKLIWQSIAEAEYKRGWDRQNRPSGWQREKAKRNGPAQSDAR